jgi:hypothetical protein
LSFIRPCHFPSITHSTSMNFRGEDTRFTTPGLRVEWQRMHDDERVLCRPGQEHGEQLRELYKRQAEFMDKHDRDVLWEPCYAWHIDMNLIRKANRVLVRAQINADDLGRKCLRANAKAVFAEAASKGAEISTWGIECVHVSNKHYV